MIARGEKTNFFVAHYDWLLAGVGVLALVAGAVYFVQTLQQEANVAAAADIQRLRARQPSETGVEPFSLTEFSAVTKLAHTPVMLVDVSVKEGSFLNSERRMRCMSAKCQRILPANLRAPVDGSALKCPFCQAELEVAKPKNPDTDGDGIPDDIERKWGMNPNDATDATADADGDGFTNLEEFKAKTDPKDAKDHPDYVASLTLTLPLKETYLPFVFRKANQIPGSWRCEFFAPKRKDNYGRKGATLTAKIGEQIADTGFVVKSYVPKTEKRAIKGASGLTRSVDVSEAVVERTSDKKVITLVAQQGKAVKPVPMDVQATLVYARGTPKTFEVVPGSEITLNGEKYKVVSIETVQKKVQVTLEKTLGGKKSVISALEE